MKNYNVHYDVVTAIDDNGKRKVIDVTGKTVKIDNAADDLNVQSAVAAIEGRDDMDVVITACSSSDVVAN